MRSPSLLFQLRRLALLLVVPSLVACSDDESEFVPPAASGGSSSQAGAGGKAGSSQGGTSANAGQGGSGDAGAGGSDAGAGGSDAGAGGNTAGSGGSNSGSGGSNAGSGGSDAGSGGSNAGSGGSDAGSGGSDAGAGGSDAGAGGSEAGSGGSDAGVGGADAGAGGSDGGSGGSDAGAGGSAAGSGGSNAGAGGGGGAGGGPSTPCLPGSAFSKVLTLESSSPLCVVRVHKTELATLGFAFSANWGRHGGPLSTDTSNGVAEVRRWQLPSDPQGAISSAAPVTVDIPGLLPGIFYGPAIDVPFHDWTMISYTGKPPAFEGELIAMDGELKNIIARNSVNGFFSGVALPGSKQRLLYTGLSPVMTSANAAFKNGLFFVDPCDATSILKTGCGASAKLGEWGANSGPIAVDAAGNLFAGASTFGDKQEVRGFVAAEASGSELKTGQVLLSDTDFSTSLVALGGGDGKSGLLVVQASDSTSFSAKTAQVFEYTTGVNGLSAQAVANGGFAAKKAGASPVLFASGDGQLWVAVDGEDGTYFAALEHKLKADLEAVLSERRPLAVLASPRTRRREGCGSGGDPPCQPRGRNQDHWRPNPGRDLRKSSSVCLRGR